MGFEHKYPYSDFHELNLDWILGVVKRLETEWPEFKTTLETEWNEYKDGLTGEGGEWPTFKTQIETTVNNLIHDVVGPYNENLDYKMGMFCYYEGNVYKCNLGSSAAFPRPFNSYSWFSYAGQNTNSIVNDLFNYLTNSLDSQDTEIFRWIQNTAAQWDETTEYKAGDYCSALVGGAFNPASWRYYRCLQDCTNIYIFDTNYWKEVIFASDVAERIADYKQAMQDQYDEFLEDYQRTFGVVQVRGSSTTDVMSQKAVSDELQIHDDLIDNLINDIAPKYDSTKAYKIGILLTYNGKMYECIADAPVGTLPTNTTYFEEKSVADIIEMIKSGEITVGKANLANNFDSKMVLTDNSGYLYRTTGGSLEIGGQNRVKKIVGASVPIIQLLDQPTITVAGLTITKNADKSYTINGTATESKYVWLMNVEASLVGHKLWAVLKNVSGTGGMSIKNGNSAATITNTIVNVASNFPYDVYITEGTEFVNYRFYLELFDITDTFGTTVANRLYALEQAQAGTGIAKAKEILVKDYYPYNETAFTHTKTSGKVNNGFNQFNLPALLEDIGDPLNAVSNAHLNNTTLWVNDVGYTGQVGIYKNGFIKNAGSSGSVLIIFYYTDGTSEPYYSTGVLEVDNYVKSNVNKVVSEIKLVYENSGSYNCTNAKMCVYLAWDGERDGEYEPYEEWNYPVEDIELKGILSLDAQDNWVADGDEYLPSGVVNNVWNPDKIFNLADFTWELVEGEGYWFWVASYVNGYVCDSSNNLCWFSNYYVTNNSAIGGPNNAGYVATNVIRIKTDDKTVTPTGWLWIKYQTPTESSATPYTELQNDSNWGTEKWIDTRDVPMPVFSTCEYIPDLKAKLETAPESPDEDGDYIMHRENGINSYGSLSTWLSANNYYKMQDLLSVFAVKENAGGILRQMLADRYDVDFANTIWLDMGDLSYTAFTLGDVVCFYSEVISGMKVITKAVSPMYKYVGYRGDITGNMQMGFFNTTDKQLVFRNEAYTDATAFKNAMKGILVAVEKA